MKILIVDDNDLTRKLCRALLVRNGFEVEEAADGVAGLEAARREPPALILLDIQMPELDGLEVVRRLRDDPALREVPVVALTAYAMKGDREQMLAAGFVDYVSQPIDIDQFLEIVKRLTARRRQE